MATLFFLLAAQALGRGFEAATNAALGLFRLLAVFLFRVAFRFRAGVELAADQLDLRDFGRVAPPEPETLNRLFDHMQSEELILFSTDYPHWQFDGDEVLPKGLSPGLVRKIMVDNPMATYGRLSQSATKEMTR